MIRRTTIVLLELAAALAAGLVILAGIAVWQLSTGPISLAFLTPQIERSMSPENAKYRVKIADTELTWDRWQDVDVRASGVQIFLIGEDTPLATLPRISIDLSVPALFRGMVAPTNLEIIEPSIRVTRAADGHFELGLSDQPGGDEAAIQGVVASLLAPPDERRPTGYLETVRIRGAELTLDDKRLKQTWVAPSTDITLTRDALGIRAAIDLAVEVDDERAQLTGELVYDLKQETFAFSANFFNLQPATYSAAMPMLAPLASVRVPLDGSIEMQVTAAGEVLAAQFDVKGGSGELAIPALYDQPVPIRGFRSRGRVADNLGAWKFEEIFVDLGGATAQASGTVTEIGNVLELRADAEFHDVSAETLVRLWPAAFATDAREWTERNVTAGIAHQINLKVSAQAPADDIEDVELQWIAATASYSGVTLRYHDQLPPLTEAAGTATLLPTRYDFDVRSGRLGGLDVEDGEIHITEVGPDQQDVETRFVSRGSLQRLLKILDSPFINFTETLGLDPAGTDGLVALRLQLRFPLRKDLALTDIQRIASATMSQVHAVDGPFGLTMSDGRLSLRLDAKQMEIRGPIKMNGVPTQIKWIENQLPGGDFQSRVTVNTALSKGDWTELGAPMMDYYITGPVPVEFVYTDVDRVTQYISMAANLHDARITVPELGWVKPAGRDGALRMRVQLDKDKPVKMSKFQLAAGDLVAEGNGVFNAEGTALKRFSLSKLEFGGEEGVDATMTVTVRDDGGYDVALGGRQFDARPYLGTDQAFIDFPMTITADLERLRVDDARLLADVQAEASYDGAVWQAIDLSADLIATGTDVRVHLKRQSPGAVEVSLVGERFNAEPYLENASLLNLAVGATPPGKDPPPVASLHWTPWAMTANAAAAVAGFRLQVPEIATPMTLRFDVDEVRLDANRSVVDVGAAGRYDGKFWRVIELCAGLVEGGTVELRYRPEGDNERLTGHNLCPDLRQGKPIDLAYQREGRQELIIFSDNAGAALRAFSNSDGFKKLKSGELGLWVLPDLTNGEDRLRGRMSIRNFQLVDPPMLAQLVSALSIVSIGEILTSNDMSFSTLFAEFDYTDTRIEVARVWAFSPGVAFHAQGYIDIAENYMKMEADVAPFEPINKLLRLFPGQVARALVGLDEKGIVAIPMRIEGPIDAPTYSPELSPQPIAPGFLRNLLEWVTDAEKDLSTQTRIKPKGDTDSQ